MWAGNTLSLAVSLDCWCLPCYLCCICSLFCLPSSLCLLFIFLIINLIVFSCVCILYFLFFFSVSSFLDVPNAPSVHSNHHLCYHYTSSFTFYPHSSFIILHPSSSSITITIYIKPPTFHPPSTFQHQLHRETTRKMLNVVGGRFAEETQAPMLLGGSSQYAIYSISFLCAHIFNLIFKQPQQ